MLRRSLFTLSVLLTLLAAAAIAFNGGSSPAVASDPAVPSPSTVLDAPMAAAPGTAAAPCQESWRPGEPGVRDKKGRKLGDGDYFVRFFVKAKGGNDIRRIALQRTGGRFTVLSQPDRRDTCGALRKYKLSGPIFGGRTEKPLGIIYRLGIKAIVTAVVKRDGEVVKRFTREGAPADQRPRFTLPSKGLKRGDYDVTLTAKAGDRDVSATLTSRRI